MTSTTKKWLVAAVAVGAMVGSAGIAAAATGSGTTTPAPAASTPAPKYNTDPAHEAGESTQRQADEASGKAGFGGGPGGRSNTDPAHEAGESAARQAEELARDAASGTSGSPSASGTATPSN